MCQILITKLQCKKANCTNIYASFRDEEESEYCENEGSTDQGHQVRQQTRTEKGDEYCLDCEASIATRRLTREVNEERARNESQTTQEQVQLTEEQRRQRDEEERQRQENDRRQRERREREREEYERTGKWPGVNMQSGFDSSKDHNSRKKR